jgi:NADH-quinone oxidoreductase subunit J
MSFMEFIMAVMALASGVAVIMFRNPLYSAFALVGNLLTIAGLYALLDAHFLAVTQVVVYAGAIMVLVLFVLMLLNLKSEQGKRPGIMQLATALLGGVILVITALPPVVSRFQGLSTHELADNLRASEGTVQAIGQELYSNYTSQFELSSLVLLIGIVGAVMLSKRKQPQLGPRPGGLFAGEGK